VFIKCPHCGTEFEVESRSHRRSLKYYMKARQKPKRQDVLNRVHKQIIHPARWTRGIRVTIARDL